MTDTLLSALAATGLPVLFVTTLLSCLGLPLPAARVLMAAGALAAEGTLEPVLVASSGLAGAIIGDQVGYFLGRRGGAGRVSPLLDRARVSLDRHGIVTVYLTRWLLAPLGPWVNLAAGASHWNWSAFTGASLAGEATWVALYAGIGFLAAGQIEAIAALLSDIGLFLAAAAITAVIGRRLFFGSR